MHKRRDSKLVSWITASILAALLAYPLSFGPACCLADRGAISLDAVIWSYAPLFRAARKYQGVAHALDWYACNSCPKTATVPLVVHINTKIDLH
jgi:hypothetical protein